MRRFAMEHRALASWTMLCLAAGSAVKLVALVVTGVGV